MRHRADAHSRPPWRVAVLVIGLAALLLSLSTLGAEATEVGRLDVLTVPMTANQLLTLQTYGFCPAGSQPKVWIEGQGLPHGIVLAPPRDVAATTEGHLLYTTRTIAEALGADGLTPVIGRNYDILVICRRISDGAHVKRFAERIPLSASPSRDYGNVETTVPRGALIMSIPDDTVTLPTPTLREDGAVLQTQGPFHDVTVTDTRAGDPGWAVSARVTNFAGEGTEMISGNNLGWEPLVREVLPGQDITLGPVIDPAPGIAPGESNPDPDQGLMISRTLAVAAPGGGMGTAVLGADLTLLAPTSTTPGTYVATLTLTAI